MTELLNHQPRSDERRDCVVTGKHLHLAMVAAGVEHDTLPSIASEAGVFESTIIESRRALHETGYVAFDRRFEDTLTAKGKAYIATETADMIKALDIVNEVGVKA